MSITASSISHRSLRKGPQPAFGRCFGRKALAVLSPLIAALVTAAGFASSSCASPRFPINGYPLRSYAEGYEVQVLIDGVPANTYEHAGESYVLGQLGARYTLRLVNHTGRRIEAVVSVDGRDAIDGKSADVRTKRGYLVPAWGTVDVDGWRLSRAEVAAFRFSSVADSYAARTGSARDVGVIGVAVFPERYLSPPRPLYTPPRGPTYPFPRWRHYEDDTREDARDDTRGLGKNAAPADRGGRAQELEESTAEPSAAPKRSSERGSIDEAAPSPPASHADGLAQGGAPRPSSRPGLGTEFGEAVSSPVREVGFVRANSTRPSVILGAHYNDRDGLLALGINVDLCCASGDDMAWRQSATPFPVSDRRYAAPPPGWQQGCCMRY